MAETKAPLTLKIGKEFELYEAKRSLLNEWNRAIVSILVVIGCLGMLVMAVIKPELYGGDDALLIAWGLVSVPLTAVITSVLKGKFKSGEKGDD